MKNTPLYDTTLSNRERAEWIVSQLTIEEKLQCFAGHPEIERLGLPAYRFGGEGAHGLQARAGQGEDYPPTRTTSLTQPIGMASSWDTGLMREAGNVTGTEARAFYNMHGQKSGATRWAPTIELCRDPRWGRTEESYGEDPLLTGKMAGAYVEGMQDEHNYNGSSIGPGERGDRIRIGCNLKHFYANNMEWRRCFDSVDVSEKVKYDYELEPYRYCIEESHAEGVMTAYNGVGGVPGLFNRDVQEILKDKWGMKHAVTDGGAFSQAVNLRHHFESHAETFAETVRAGVDNMLDYPPLVAEAAKEAWDKGLITEEEIDKSLTCMFESRIRLGAFDEKDPYKQLGEKDIGTRWAGGVSKKMAEESNVLLKNTNHFLPFNIQDDIVMIGPCGDTWYQDWYGGNPMYTNSLREGVEEMMRKPVRFESGLNLIRLKADGRYVGAADEENPRLILVDDVKDALVFEHTDWGCGSNFLYAPEYERFVNFDADGDLRLASDQVFGWFVTENFTIIPAEGAVRLDEPHNANMVEFDRYWDDCDGDVKIYGFGARPVYVKDGYLKGTPLSILKNMLGTKEGQNMADKYTAMAGEPAAFTVEVIHDGIASAKRLAKTAGKVIVALGCNPVINAKEEVDRTTINMIPYQERLLQEVYSVNPNIAVVLMANYPYAISWMQENVPAILLNATGSQDMGYGLASAIFGDSVPAGRLPMTWYLRDEDLPSMDDYEVIDHPRTYRYFEKPVLYPFGYGLSYSSFAYQGISVKATEPGRLVIIVNVTNTGSLKADEVVQVYMKRISESETVHPARRLIAFERMHNIVPGETRIAAMTVNPGDLAIYSEKRGGRFIEPGEYLIYAGSNALDEAIKVAVEL